MRIRHSLTALVPVLVMLVTGPKAQAQYGSPYPSAAPGSYGGYPANSPMSPQGVPAGFMPHPGVSPYDNLFEQHYNSDGLWFKNATNGFGGTLRPRDFFLNVDYTMARTRQLGGIVGAPGVQSYLQQNDPENDEIIDGLAFYNYFNAANGSMINSVLNNGMKVSGGFWNPDGTGLLADFTWNADSFSRYDARQSALKDRLDTATIIGLQMSGGTDAIPVNLNGRTDLDLVENEILAPGSIFDSGDLSSFGNFGSTFDILDRTLLNLHGIPIDNGSLLGVTVPYDIQFVLEQRISNLGGSVAGAMNPIVDRDNLRIHPIVGGRYYRIDEEFSFYGVDSGLAYGVDNGDNDTPENAKVFPPGDGIDDNDDFIADNPNDPGDTTFEQINPSDPSLVRAHLNSQVISDLGGPEAGLFYILGDAKGISITGSTKVAALLNFERMSLGGDNIGDHMGVDLITGPDATTGLYTPTDMFDTDTTNGPTQNAFTDYKSSTHVSPLFEQSLNAEFPIFRRIPVLKDMRQMQDAKLRLGWSYLFIAEVADPLQSVRWQSNPRAGLFPTIQRSRDDFSQTTFNIGINWNY